MEPHFESHHSVTPHHFKRPKPSRTLSDFWKKLNKRKIATWIAINGLVIGLLGVLALVGVAAWFSRDLPDPNKLLSRSVALSTKIYDRTGTHVLYEIHGDQQRTLVTIQEIPTFLKHATITTEDRDFYNHQGFDIKGIIRAIAKDVLRGGKAQGGSTITQQYIKNALLTNEKTFTRKIKELVLAYQLEKNFSKDQILQLYLNEIPYGSSAYGVQAAAQVYFGKHVKDLTLAESALLAALPKAPSLYSPWGNNRDLLIARQQKILDDMVSEGYITQNEADSAKAQNLAFQEQRSAITAPHFVMYVKQLLNEKYDTQTVEQGGLKVTTSLDYDKQLIAEEEVKKGATSNEKFKAQNAALVSLDAKTGEILAMVGSKDYFNDTIDGKVNVVLRQRQPGSSFKPIVYAQAFIKGYTPRTTIYDVLTNFAVKGNDYIPKNYTGKEYGPVSMRQALAGSLNIAAVKTLYLAGVGDVINLAKQLGYTSLQDPDRYGLTLVLGGGEVTLLEHTTAFTAFAQRGAVAKPVSILKIEDKQGHVLEELKTPETKTVFEAKIADYINDILSDNTARAFVFSGRNALQVPGLQTAAKTGTTNDNRDAWTIGYTPNTVTGVWVGNNKNTPMSKGADGSVVAAPIWSRYMQRALKGSDQGSFVKPEIEYTGKGILDGRTGRETKVKIDKTTKLLATESTPPELVEEKLFYEAHDILYYVRREDPRGDAPTNPNDDSQFAIWENALQSWIARTKFVVEQPPTTSDSVHTPENTPTLAILSLTDGVTISDPRLAIQVETTAPRGVKHVDYFIDDRLLESVTVAPYHLSTIITGFANGAHTLSVKSYDDVGNVKIQSLQINLNITQSLPVLRWSIPSDVSIVKTGSLKNILIEIDTPPDVALSIVRRVSVSVTNASGDTQTIGSVISPSSTQISLPWPTQLTPGDYIFTAEAVGEDGVPLAQKNIRVTVE